MKRVEGFAELDDATILDRVGEARDLAADKERLRDMQSASLLRLLEQFEGVMNSDEVTNVRSAIRDRRITPAERAQLRLDENRVRGGSRVF